MDFVKELQQSKKETIDIIVEYIINTLKAKALFSKGGWKEVRKHIRDEDCFNHHFGISSIAIYSKLKENEIPVNISIKSNMKVIEKSVNDKLSTEAVEYYVHRKNHSIRIII